MENKKNTKKKVIVIVAICVLFIGVGIGLYIYAKQPDIVFNNDKEKVVLNEDYDPKSFVKSVKGHNLKNVKIDTSEVDLNKVGKYKIIYQINDKKYILNVEVVDNQAPVLEVKDLDLDVGMNIKAEDFVEQLEDQSETTVSFAESYDFTKAGEQEVTIVAEDECHNKTEKTAKLTLVDDEEKPTLNGLRDIEVSVGAKINYLLDIEAKDNRDPNPKVEVDSSQVDTSKEGKYEVAYTVSDRSGNKNVYKKQVTIIKKEIQSVAPNKDKVVYLTFDDGPSNQTERILEILEKYNAKATFFVTGQNANYRYLIKKAYEDGHTIALHTYSHKYSKVYASVDAYFDDLNKVGEVVKEQIGFVPHYIRFPGGSSNLVSAKYSQGIMSTLTQEVQNRGYQFYDWNADTTDASGNNVSVGKLIACGTSSCANNIMILAHDTAAKATTADALPAIIEHYQSLGYTFKGIDDDTFTPHQPVNN